MTAPFLPDILAPKLRVLFVGFNPSVRAAETGHHYAGRGNAFWRLLFAADLTPRLLRPDEDRELTRWGLGSTNLVARPTASAAQLSRAELRAGMPRVQGLVASLRPHVVAYTGKGVYLAGSGLSSAPWGAQAGSLSGALDFVLPSPSGLAKLPFEQKLRWYRALRAFAGDPR